jgi:hypothetical protein
MNTQTDIASNIAQAKAQAFDQIRDLGRREGKGKTARLALAEYVTARSREGLFSVEDNERIWTEMMQGAAEEQTDVGGLEPKDTKQRASDIKHFIVLGSNKTLDGVEMLDNAKTRMKHMRASGASTGRVWELILAFARAQNKEPERALTDQEIDKIFADKTAAERELADKFWGARQTLIKANEGNDFEDIYEACELIEKRVAELGGTRKQKKQAEAAAKKAKEEAKKAKAEAKKVERQGAKGAKGAKAAAQAT